MICYHNLGEIAHDVVTACLVRIGIKKRARCCDSWDLGHCSFAFYILRKSHSMTVLVGFEIELRLIYNIFLLGKGDIEEIKIRIMYI